MSNADLPVRNGVFVAVVGPSGAGKDTLIAYARESFAGSEAVEFVRRVHHPAERRGSEDHDTLADARFRGSREGRRLRRVVGRARPALRTARRHRPVDRQRPCGRRQHLARRNPADQGALRQCRHRRGHRLGRNPRRSGLSARGRESRGEVLARLARSAELGSSVPGAVRIDNSGTREEAGERFVAVLRKAIAFSDVAGTV